MPNMTLSIPEQVQKKMSKHSEVKWSNVAREAIEKKVEQLEWMDSVLSKSELTEEDAEEIGHGIKAMIAKRWAKRFGK